jgi:hypothetical protein
VTTAPTHWPGMTAAEARAMGDDVPLEVPDDALLCVEAMQVLDYEVREDGSRQVTWKLIGARWVWDPDDAPN